MRIVSLFAGAGGMDLGFVQAGHHIVWANDNDRDAVATYSANVGSHIVLGDIEQIDATTIPDCEAVIGGFPCQGFSRANRRRSEGDNRNKLYLEFLRVLKAKRPMYFVAENVPGILSLDEGRVMEMIVSDFDKCGYVVDHRLFNLADYGVPQTRRRVIIQGRRDDLPEHLNPEFPEPTYSRLPTLDSKKRWVSVAEALEGIPEPESTNQLANHVYSRYKVTNRNFTGHRLTDPDKPSPTILARGNGKGGVCALSHPKNHRRMSVREQAVIQTFPLNFEFKGKMNSCYRQVGNAVPVLFAKQLGEKLRSLETLCV